MMKNPIGKSLSCPFALMSILRMIHVTADRCVRPAQVLQEARAIRDLNALGAQVFPRNGFLLGVIRHGGYLPHETPDADLAVLYEDVVRMGLAGAEGSGRRNLRTKRERGIPVGDFRFDSRPVDPDTWVNWKGLNPLTGEPYPFYNTWWVSQRSALRVAASAVYPWGTTEGANVRLLETDELVTEENYAPGKQMGWVFPTKIDCMVEKQFYFTTIPVPCGYETI